jgi:hypothetical protein
MLFALQKCRSDPVLEVGGTYRHKVSAMRKSCEKKKYNTAIVFLKEMIAPCGMNCGSCLGYMRTEIHCPGCRSDTDSD